MIKPAGLETTYKSLWLFLLAGLLSACIEKSENNYDVQIHWQPVTEYLDGSAITALNHYEIHYGHHSDVLNTVEYSRNPELSAYVITDLTPGEYYFSVVAVSDSGIKSAPSIPYYFHVSE